MMGRKFPCLLEAPGKQASVFICGKWMKSSFSFGKVEEVRCGITATTREAEKGKLSFRV